MSFPFPNSHQKSCRVSVSLDTECPQEENNQAWQTRGFQRRMGDGHGDVRVAISTLAFHALHL